MDHFYTNFNNINKEESQELEESYIAEELDDSNVT